jgi:hypothetical protein
MQTLLDPYELASASVPRPDMPPPALPVIDVASRDDVTPPAPNPPSPDSSSRLRCWCSED